MRRISRVLAVAAAIAGLGAPAEAYYHYVFYSSRSAPFSPIEARFDLTRLTNNTVVFCVYDSGPANFFPNDSFPSVLAGIKQALAAWNSVPNSQLHVAFGGLEYAGQNANTPGGDVIFQDLGPGLLGLGTPNLPSAPQLSGTGGVPFVAISRSTVILTNNTGVQPGPSYLEEFFTTAVHEFGHALGLQHTWTSSAMSQDVIRNTSRARPLDADDIAGFLELYGVAGWTANYGSISGRVSFTNGGAATLASVVAIPATGPAVSALTNPDGTYTINGLPPNTYLLYVHPLPPDAVIANGSGLLLPTDQSGASFAAGGSFRTVFYPNTVDPNQATQFAISGGAALSQQNFTVQSRSGVPAYDLLVSSYANPAAHNYVYNPTGNIQTVNPAFLNTSLGSVEFLVQANSGSTPVPNSIAILGLGSANSCAAADVLPCFWAFGSSTNLAGYFGLSAAAGTGPRHLIFNYGNDMYVLPDGLVLVQQGPPYINSVNSNGDGTVTVGGGNFGPDSRVFFDGLQAPATSAPSQNSIVVTPPSGTSGQVSAVTVFNSDGQNSMQFYLEPQDAPTFQYPIMSVPQIINITPAAGLPIGNSGAPYSTELDITAMNIGFVDGQVAVGAGSSDVTVNRVWVIGPTELRANVTVASGAAIGNTELSVMSGFQVMTAGFQTLPANGVLPLISGILSADSYMSTVYSGGYGAVYGTNLQAAAAPTATLSGTPIGIQFYSGNQVNFIVPAGFPAGPAILNLSNGSGSVNIVVPIGNPGPAIQGLSNSQGPVDATHPANVGDVLSVLVSGIDPSSVPALSSLQVSVSGLPMAVLQIAPAPNAQFQIQFVLDQSFGGSQVPVTVCLNGSPSGAYTIAAH
jgi:hypothetical protein